MWGGVLFLATLVTRHDTSAGNHEERSVHSQCGFQAECNAKYGPDDGAAAISEPPFPGSLPWRLPGTVLGATAYELFSEAFDNLPLATILNDKARARRPPPLSPNDFLPTLSSHRHAGPAASPPWQVLVLHGGVDDEMTLEQLERLPRKEYTVNQARRFPLTLRSDRAPPLPPTPSPLLAGQSARVWPSGRPSAPSHARETRRDGGAGEGVAPDPLGPLE